MITGSSRRETVHTLSSHKERSDHKQGNTSNKRPHSDDEVVDSDDEILIPSTRRIAPPSHKKRSDHKQGNTSNKRPQSDDEVVDSDDKISKPSTRRTALSTPVVLINNDIPSRFKSTTVQTPQVTPSKIDTSLGGPSEQNNPSGKKRVKLISDVTNPTGPSPPTSRSSRQAATDPDEQIARQGRSDMPIDLTDDADIGGGGGRGGGEEKEEEEGEEEGEEEEEEEGGGAISGHRKDIMGLHQAMDDPKIQFEQVPLEKLRLDEGDGGDTEDTREDIIDEDGK